MPIECVGSGSITFSTFWFFKSVLVKSLTVNSDNSFFNKQNTFTFGDKKEICCLKIASFSAIFMFLSASFILLLSVL